MSLRAEDLATIRRLPLFSGLSRRTAARLLVHARAHHFGAGSLLFRENDTADYLHVALDGHVCLKAVGGKSMEHVIELVPPGQLFIIAAVLLDKPYLMSAHVIQDGRVLLLPAAEFRECANN